MRRETGSCLRTISPSPSSSSTSTGHNVHNFPTDWRFSHASYHSPARTAYWRLHAALKHCNSLSILSPGDIFCVIPVSLLLARAAFFALDRLPSFIFPLFQKSYDDSNFTCIWLCEPRIDLQFFLPSFSSPLVVQFHKHRRGNKSRPFRRDRRSRSQPPLHFTRICRTGLPI